MTYSLFKSTGSQEKINAPRKAPMKIQIIMYPLKYIANNMMIYATANCAICINDRTVCSTSDGRYGARLSFTPTTLVDADCFVPFCGPAGVMSSSVKVESALQQLPALVVLVSSLRSGTLEAD